MRSVWLPIEVQFAPEESQRSQPIENAVGEPVQLPPVAVSVEPTCATPVRSGRELLTGVGGDTGPHQLGCEIE